MSASLSWERPPVEVEREGPRGLLAENLLIDLLFDGSRDIADTVIKVGDPTYHHLCGVLDGLMRIPLSDEHQESCDDVERLLGVIAKYGSAVVRVER